MSKKKPRPRNAGKKPEELPAYDFIQYCAKRLKARVAAGVYRDRPGLEAAITDFDPAVYLIEVAADPANTVDLRAPAAAKLLPYWHREQSLVLKQGDGAQDRSITIVVASWAADGSQAPRLPAPVPRAGGRAVEAIPTLGSVEAVDVEERAHSGMNSQPAPALSDHERLREQARNRQPQLVLDVPPSPTERPRVIAQSSQQRTPHAQPDLKRKFTVDWSSAGRDETPTPAANTTAPLFGTQPK